MPLCRVLSSLWPHVLLLRLNKLLKCFQKCQASEFHAGLWNFPLCFYSRPALSLLFLEIFLLF